MTLAIPFDLPVQDEARAGEAVPQWWDTAGGAIFGWVHGPEGAARETAVVLVPPLGPEYLHSHRAVRHLARRLAQAGFPVVRYDHPGYGDSTELDRDADAVPQWCDAVGTAVRAARAIDGVTRVVVVALRSASLLASQAAGPAVDGVVLWYPYLRGSAFVRDLQLLDAALELPATDGSHREAGGYSISRATEQGLGALEATAWSSLQPRAALLVHEEGLPVNRRLAERLAAGGAGVEEIAMGGRPGMMRQAELMEVPEADVEAIVAWVQGAFPERAGPGAGVPPAPRAEVVGGGWRERAVWLSAGDRRCFGIITEGTAAADDADPRPLFVVLNAGAAHHVGPNGLHPQLCRRAAQEGWTALRMDIPGLGESSDRVARESHHPYPMNVGPMLWSVLAPLAEAVHGRIVLAGLCSGARNAYKTALAAGAGRVRGLILLNPLTLYFVPGDDIFMPAATRPGADAQWLRSGSRGRREWLALLANPQRVRRVGARAIRAIARGVSARAINIGRALGMVAPPRLVRDLRGLLHGGTRMAILTHPHEPGVHAIRRVAASLLSDTPAPRTVHVRLLPAADHTFTRRASRDELVDHVITALREANP